MSDPGNARQISRIEAGKRTVVNMVASIMKLRAGPIARFPSTRTPGLPVDRRASSNKAPQLRRFVAPEAAEWLLSDRLGGVRRGPDARGRRLGWDKVGERLPRQPGQD